MQTTKKKPYLPLIAIGAVLSLYGGYLAGGAYKKGMNLWQFLDAFSRVWEHPVGNYFNEYTLKAVAVTCFVYTIALIMYYTSQRNFMPGKEYGTARIATPQEANRKLRDKDPQYNRILSQNVRMSLDTRHTKLNNNILIIGGSGAGKTFYEVKPNLMQMPKRCSFICTDPKGEILRSCGGMLQRNGYNVKVINLLEMDKSDGYNPFSYIREETDVVKLITNLISNTTPKGSAPSDPFWEKAEGLFLQALFYYVWMEEPPDKQNFKTVLKLLAEAEVQEQGKPSKLDVRMKYLEETNPMKENHPAVKQYNKVMRGAGDTVRSIIISVNSRLAYLENQQVLKLLEKDELNLAELGIGVNGDETTKTALFCVIPDSDKSYNFIIGMLYTQIFQELYYQADFKYGGRLPIHVTFMLDEFANVALPDDFCSLLSTMRSREISSIIIIQNLAQIKALFKDTWETIPGNCDTLIYLGGNEQSTHKYISELLGKGTIDKKSSGETRGRQGSSSRNYDVLGRELLTPDEARKFDNQNCIIFIRGLDPVVDKKFIPFGHRMFKQTADGGGAPFVYKRRQMQVVGKEFELLGERALKFYENQQQDGKPVYIDNLKLDELELLSEMEVRERFQSMVEKQQKEKRDEEQGNELEYTNEEADNEATGEGDSIMKRMTKMQFSKEQKDELRKAIEMKMPEEEILKFFYPDVPVEQMRDFNRGYEQFIRKEGRN
ncbi:type IV secretion system protein VirD4 [Lachnospiraceae bacterium XBB1006]|nr:type IV secretion system protein VirD4 [Lachnospiraceae bacterium XBB1006]